MRITRRARRAGITAIVLATSLAMVSPASPSAAQQQSAGLAAMAADLKADCENHDEEAGSLRGWARNRFELCHHYEQQLNLYDSQTLQYLGKVIYDFWVLGFAHENERKVDYVVSFEDLGVSGYINASLAYLTVTVHGCTTSNVTCTGPTTRSDNIPGWYASPTMAFSVSSPQNTGTGPYYLQDLLTSFETLIEHRNGQTIPYTETRSLDGVRFDSAAANLGNGPHHGAVFIDYVPTLELSMQPGSNHLQEARHVNDAFEGPERTFPSHHTKAVPGKTIDRPLHRLMDATKKSQNHNASVGICQDVWGTDYAANGLQCDEFPFQSTYEGSYTSTAGLGGPSKWNGSARPIDGNDNQQGGTKLANFYGSNRILDGDAFLIRVLT